jgi:cytochrome c oxidase assembly protein Cox11
VREILFAAPRGQELDAAEQERLLKELEQLYESNQLPTYTTEPQFELVKEAGGWAVVENYAAAVRVHFSSEVKNDLLWEVEPLQETVLGRPGETLTAVYRVKNLSDQPVTAKARHLDSPADFVNDVTLIQCFCFIQQTLQPGVEVEMPLIFRVDQDASAEMKDFYILYEFYPIEDFPG